jgi:hypothetical protein
MMARATFLELNHNQKTKLDQEPPAELYGSERGDTAPDTAEFEEIAVASRAVANWNRFNSCWGMRPCRRRNTISAANRISDTRSTIFLTSQRTDGRMKTMLNLPERKPPIL